MNSDVRAFGIGMAVFVGLHAAYWVTVATVTEVNRLLGSALLALGYAAPLVSGGVTAFLSQRRQFTALFALGIAASVVAAVANFLGASLGASSDFPGLKSVPLVALLSLLVQVPLVLVGGALVGIWQRSRHA